MQLTEQVKQLKTREEFVAFVYAMVQDWREQRAQWENSSLDAYLEALAAWVQDMEGYYGNRGKPVPQQFTWENLGEILLAASVYE